MTRIAIVGDYTASFRPHAATNEALEALLAQGCVFEYEWVGTDTILPAIENIKNRYDGYWIAPGSPYRSMAGALALIRHARENGIPVFGTCGGFQHMVIEYARNVLHIADAQHAEYDPYASRLVVTPLSCSLAGQQLEVLLTNSKARSIYGRESVLEKYYCNFGLNPEYQQLLHAAGLRTVGSDAGAEARIVELADHPFFIATLFVPQNNLDLNRRHPLITGFVDAATNAMIDRDRRPMATLAQPPQSSN